MDLTLASVEDFFNNVTLFFGKSLMVQLQDQLIPLRLFPPEMLSDQFRMRAELSLMSGQVTRSMVERGMPQLKPG